MTSKSQPENDLLKLFTIVTVSYERKVFLNRYLETSEKNGFYTILVDGTKDIHDGSIPENVSYFHMPSEDAHTRLAFAVEKVMTPYIVLLADDDFLLPSVLLKAVEFLRDNPDYSSVQGKVVTFNERHEKSDILYKSYKGFDSPTALDSNISAERLEAHLSNYIFTFYSLQETAIWKRFFSDVYSKLKSHPVITQRNPAIFELAQSIHCVLSGKNKMLENTYLVRESIPRPFTQGNLDFNNSVQFNEFLTDFANIINNTFRNSDIDYRILFKSCFLLFAGQRKLNYKSGDFNSIGIFAELVIKLKNDEQELSAIHRSVVSYRWDILEMLNASGITSDSYWYDASWKLNIASKFSLLAELQSDYVVFGAGEHTQNLANSVGLGEGIKCIVDSNPENWGKNIMGLQCINPNDILRYSNNVIISSQSFEREIFDTLRATYTDSINVFTLYE